MDAELRQLERRWQESCAPEDEAAYLNALVRTGDLSSARLQLAAAVGHEAAAIAVGGTKRPRLKLAAWLRQVVKHDPACATLAARAVAVQTFEACSICWGVRPALVLQAVDDWLISPDPTNEQHLRDVMGNERERHRPPTMAPTADTDWEEVWAAHERDGLAIELLDALVWMCAYGRLADARIHSLEEVARHAERLFLHNDLTAEDARTRLAAAVRDALVPWALGR